MVMEAPLGCVIFHAGQTLSRSAAVLWVPWVSFLFIKDVTVLAKMRGPHQCLPVCDTAEAGPCFFVLDL